jgi:hypothetical protein
VGFLIDTCIWVEVERGRMAPSDVASFTGEEPVYLSPVTIAELRFGAEIAANPDLRQKRLAAVERLRRSIGRILRIFPVWTSRCFPLPSADRAADLPGTLSFPSPSGSRATPGGPQGAQRMARTACAIGYTDRSLPSLPSFMSFALLP